MRKEKPKKRWHNEADNLTKKGDKISLKKNLHLRRKKSLKMNEMNDNE